MESLLQCGHQDTWVTPSCRPGALGPWGKSDYREDTRVLQCFVLEVTHIVVTCIPVLVLY